MPLSIVAGVVVGVVVVSLGVGGAVGGLLIGATVGFTLTIPTTQHVVARDQQTLIEFSVNKWTGSPVALVRERDLHQLVRVHKGLLLDMWSLGATTVFASALLRSKAEKLFADPAAR